MRTSIAAGTALVALALVAPLPAQQVEVEADILVQSGSMTGHVLLGDGYSTYHRPPPPAYRAPEVRRVVIVERYAPRAIVVERLPRHRHKKHWARHGYRPVTVYYVDGRYLEHHDDRRDGRRTVRELVVYERDGRYYRDYDDAHERDREYRARDRWAD